MDWQDEGIVLNIKAHGENAALATVLTRHQGLARGLIHGGNSKAKRPLWQPGNVLRMEWRARLSEQLGTLTGELDTPYAAGFVGAPSALPYLQSVTSLLAATLPESHPYPHLYAKTIALLDNLTARDCAAHYARYELQLLAELGFALDLSCCAATGQVHDLCYVSPRTGRAVSSEGAKGYEDKLLKLPSLLFLSPGAPARGGEVRRGGVDTCAGATTPSPGLSPLFAGERDTTCENLKNTDIKNQISDALFLTGYFLERWIFQSSTHPALKSRQRLLQSSRQMAA